MPARPEVELFGLYEELARRKERPVRIAAGELEARVGVAPELVDRRRYVLVQRQRAALRQIVEERRHRFEEKRQVVLDPGCGHAVRHVAIEALLRRVAFEELAPAAAKARPPGVVEGELARRQHADFLDGVKRALRVDVERLYGIDDVVIEVEAIGKRTAGRKEIDQAAAHTNFTRPDDLRHVLIAGGCELRF